MYVPLPNTTSRAISGGPIDLIDHLGQALHNFNLIKKLALFDGNVPRCLHHSLPTSDSLCMNPLYKESIPEISNFNKGNQHNLLFETVEYDQLGKQLGFIEIIRRLLSILAGYFKKPDLKDYKCTKLLVEVFGTAFNVVAIVIKEFDAVANK